MFAPTVAVGVGVVAAIVLTPLYVSRVPLRRAPQTGSVLVLSAVALAVLTLSGRVPAASAWVIASLLMLLAGTLLLLADERGDDFGGGGRGRNDEPPWWPEFEAELLRYSRRSPLAGGRR